MKKSQCVYMKHFKLLFMSLAVLLTMSACSDDDAPAPDTTTKSYEETRVPKYLTAQEFQQKVEGKIWVKYRFFGYFNGDDVNLEPPMIAGQWPLIRAYHFADGKCTMFGMRGPGMPGPENQKFHYYYKYNPETGFIELSLYEGGFNEKISLRVVALEGDELVVRSGYGCLPMGWTGDEETFDFMNNKEDDPGSYMESSLRPAKPAEQEDFWAYGESTDPATPAANISER